LNTTLDSRAHIAQRLLEHALIADPLAIAIPMLYRLVFSLVRSWCVFW
jgi:hypothetical protein